MDQHAISEICFLRPSFFGTVRFFFQFDFIDAPSTFTGNETFCEHRQCLKNDKMCQKATSAKTSIFDSFMLFLDVFVGMDVGRVKQQNNCPLSIGIFSRDKWFLKNKVNRNVQFFGLFIARSIFW